MYYSAPKGLGIVVSYNSQLKEGYVLLKPFNENLKDFINCYHRNEKRFKYTFVKFEWEFLRPVIKSEILSYIKAHAKARGNIHQKIKSHLLGVILNEISVTDYRNRLETERFVVTYDKVELSSFRKQYPFGFGGDDHKRHLFPKKIDDIIPPYQHFLRPRKKVDSTELSVKKVGTEFKGLVLCYCHKKKKGVLLFHGSIEGFNKTLDNYEKDNDKSTYLEFSWIDFSENVRDEISSFANSTAASMECKNLSESIVGRIVTGKIVIKPFELIDISNINLNKDRVAFSEFGKKVLSRQDYSTSLKDLYNHCKIYRKLPEKKAKRHAKKYQ